jgi:hypothetical protein
MRRARVTAGMRDATLNVERLSLCATTSEESRARCWRSAKARAVCSDNVPTPRGAMRHADASPTPRVTMSPASSSPPLLTRPPPSRTDLAAPNNCFVHTMGRDESLDALVEILKSLVPIAKAVPILGPTVEGSLEAAIRVIEFTQVSYPTYTCAAE